jgi:hypothetical protein
VKVAIKDSQILKTVNHDVIQAHLQATGWRIYRHNNSDDRL